MTKKQCPLGEACDLTIAWMAGRQHGIDWFTPIIEAKDAEIDRLWGDLAKAVEALQIARVHVANNSEGWSVSRAPSRDDLTIVDLVLAALTGAQKDGN